MNALRVALRIVSGIIIFISQFWKICGFSRIAFSREGLGTNSLSQNLTVLTAPSGREPLVKLHTLAGDFTHLSDEYPYSAIKNCRTERAAVL